MLRIRLLGMTLIAMFALTGVASAHIFEASKAGKLKRVSNTTQVFKTGGGPAVECTTVAVSNGNALAGNQLHVLADVSYSGCTVKFIFSFEAKVSTAKYLFSADLTADLENTVTISVPVAGCTVTISPQKKLLKINYKTTGPHVTVEPNVHSILSLGSGGECGTGHNKGTYTGNTLVELIGGTIGWK